MSTSQNASSRNPIATARLLLRAPGTAGLLFTLVSIPIVLVAGKVSLQTRVIVAMAALCLYPVVDVPRINGQPSWFAGAMASVVVWIVAFAMIGAAGGAVELREGSLIFLGPFVMYPLALALSAVVRLEGRLSDRPLESGPRITAIVVVIAYTLLGIWFYSAKLHPL